MKALLSITAGLGFWAIGFSLLYGLHGIGCARGWPATAIGPVDVQRLVLAATWIGSSLALFLWVRATFRTHRDVDRPLLGWLARASAVTGLVAILVSGIPILTTSHCGVGTIGMEPGGAAPVR